MASDLRTTALRHHNTATQTTNLTPSRSERQREAMAGAVWETGLMQSMAPDESVAQFALRGLRDGRTWRATAYVLVSCFSSLLLFVVTLVFVVFMLALSITIVGLPVVAPLLALVHRLVGVDRRRTGWVGDMVGVRPLVTGSLRRRLTDGSAWRHVGYALPAWFVNAFLFAAMVAVWAGPVFLMTIPLWAWAIDTPWTRLVAMPIVGAGLLLLAPSAAQGLGWLQRRYVEASVGPDRLADMERQVAEISESRSDILNAVAGERRRIERNLHDGVQQQLVALGIDLGLAEAKLESDPETARALLAEATKKTRESIGELRNIGRGLHPAVLEDRGLDAALSAVVANSTVPIELRSNLAVQPPPAIAEAAYFVVSEAVTNVMKHSKARLAVVTATSDEQQLDLSIYDDGRGGASLSGTGLAGIAARVRGFEGSFELSSPAGGPTVVAVTFPFGDPGE